MPIPTLPPFGLMLSDLFRLVEITPSPVSESALPAVLPAIEAVGVPDPVLLRKANFAELVAFEPNRTSNVELAGEMAPWLSCQRFAPAEQVAHDGFWPAPFAVLQR